MCDKNIHFFHLQKKTTIYIFMYNSYQNRALFSSKFMLVFDSIGENTEFEQLLRGLLHQAKDYLLPDLDIANV